MIFWATLCWHSQCMVGNFWSLWQGLGKRINQFIVKEDLEMRLPKNNLYIRTTQINNLEIMIPKSAILTRSGEEQRIFSGLRSRWKNPFLIDCMFYFLINLQKKFWLVVLSEPVHVGKSLEDLEDNSSHLKIWNLLSKVGEVGLSDNGDMVG